MKKLKVYGWLSFRVECRTHSGQTREIVAATSKTAAAAAAGSKQPSQMFNLDETGNSKEIAQALQESGTVFWKPLDDRSDDWNRASKKDPKVLV